MPEQEVAPKKVGVHGWRAFLWMFGCGTFAALLVFGLIFGVGRMLSSSLTSSPSSAESSSVHPSREPRSSVPPGLLDLCELIEAESLMAATSGNRVDEGGNYVDTATKENGDPRTVSDSCAWDVVGSEGKNWKFELNYTAHMEGAGDKSMTDSANETFDEFVSAVDGGEVDDQGPVGRLDGESQYFYVDSEGGRDSYDLIRLTGSGVYQIYLEGNEVSEQDFRVEAVKVAPFLDRAIERHTPD